MLPWPAICVALSMCCLFGAAFGSFFAKLKYLITTGFLIFATIRQSKAVAKLPKGLESFEESFFTTPEEK
jgi:hypothetical protein